MKSSVGTVSTIVLILILTACGPGQLGAPASRSTQSSASAVSAASASTTAGTPAAAVNLGEGAAVAVQRIGVEALKPAQPLGQPNVARDPATVPAPITRSDPTTVEIKLTAKEVNAELADGATYAFWTFDGTVPGPLLRVMEGDTVKLTLSNPADSTTSHNIDLHAVNGPGGGAAVTNVAPGETKTFTFQALNPGAYVYHCAFAPPYLHIAQGMYGAIVVEPKEIGRAHV